MQRQTVPRKGYTDSRGRKVAPGTTTVHKKSQAQREMSVPVPPETEPFARPGTSGQTGHANITYQATHDSIVDNMRPTGMVATTKSGATIDAFTSQGHVYAKSSTTGALSRLVPSGNKIDHEGQRTVSFQTAQDLGDQAGTLQFDQTESFPGKAPSALFSQPTAEM